MMLQMVISLLEICPLHTVCLSFLLLMYEVGIFGLNNFGYKLLSVGIKNQFVEVQTHVLILSSSEIVYVGFFKDILLFFIVTSTSHFENT